MLVQFILALAYPLWVAEIVSFRQSLGSYSITSELKKIKDLIHSRYPLWQWVYCDVIFCQVVNMEGKIKHAELALETYHAKKRHLAEELEEYKQKVWR